MTDRFPGLPRQELPEEERPNQCTLCGAPQIERQTHRWEALHSAREMAAHYAQGLRAQRLEETSNYP